MTVQSQRTKQHVAFWAALVLDVEFELKRLQETSVAAVQPSQLPKKSIASARRLSVMHTRRFLAKFNQQVLRAVVSGCSK